MITNNVFHRVFHIKYGSSTGTCFIIEDNSLQYFVTAKHVVEGLKNGGEIELFHNNLWNKLNVRLIGHSQLSDVSVFAIDIYFGVHPLPASIDGIAWGQDLYFLGFPFGLQSNIGPLNRDFPLPLVKKGVFSAGYFQEKEKFFYIDGHNNPGFSGGPVVFQKIGSKDFNVAGIISGYQTSLEDTFIQGKPTCIKVKTNTGIILAYSIQCALDLIAANPIGQKMPKV